MRAAIVGSLDLEHVGGGERNAQLIASKLQERGVDTTLFGGGFPMGFRNRRSSRKSYSFRYIPHAFRGDIMASSLVLRASNIFSLGLIGSVSPYRTQHMLEGFDSVYFIGPGFIFSRAAPELVRSGKRVVLGNHGTFFEVLSGKSSIKKLLKDRTTKMIFKPVENYWDSIMVHVQTKYQAEFYRQLGVPQRNIVQIPLANVSFSDYYVKKNEDMFTVTFVGRLQKNKGVDILRDICSQKTDYRVNIIGQGNYYQYLERSLKNPNARLLGYVPDAKKKEIMSMSDAMIVPSRAESLSISTIEGLASGLPSVVSDTSIGPRQIVQHNPMFGDTVRRTFPDFDRKIMEFKERKERDPSLYNLRKVQRRIEARKIFDSSTTVQKVIGLLF